MQKLHFQPRPELKGIIKDIVFLDCTNVTESGIGNRFLPDGYFEIGFNLGSGDLKITSTSSTDIQLDNPIGYFYGQSSVSSQLFSKGRLHIMIVKIYPWAASLLFNFDLSDCVNENLKLEDVFFDDAKIIEEKILTSNRYEEQVEILQQFLMKKIYKNDFSENDLLGNATKIIFQRHGNIRIKELATEINTSTRTLQRTFRQSYGISPKLLSQQVRLRYFAAQLSNHKNLNLTEIALRCGYYDQAHFNHEFRSITSVNPSEYFFNGIPLVDDFLKPG